MKVSLAWLQTYFDTPLPKAEELADLITFHAFEIEEQEGDLLDVKVLPDRAAYALSHRGIAKEVSAILNLPLKEDPLRTPLPEWKKGEGLSVELDAEGICTRYVGAYVKGVTVGPSPAWLKEALEAVGQRSINNVVDATNYVMLNIGQPLHAFDAGKLHGKIRVRAAKEGEHITTLTGDDYELTPSTLLIVDGETDTPIGIGGVKGGKHAEVDAHTTELILEAGNFDATATRRTAQKLKLFTDASLRYQNKPSPELTAYGMRDVLKLITDIAGGEVMSVVDENKSSSETKTVSASLEKINGVLGSSFTKEEVEDVFARLDLTFIKESDAYVITAPFERKDIALPEDIAEEVGRILGYDRIAPQPLPPFEGQVDQNRFHGIERMKDQLIEQGFTEVSTQSFAKKGDVYLANPLDKTMPALRTSLEGNIADALTRAKLYASLTLKPGEKPKLFEVGTVFPKEGEYLELRMSERVAAWGEAAGTVDNLSIAKLEDYGKEYEPKRYMLSTYKPFSSYPFIVRDIALWVPAGTTPESITELIRTQGTALLVRLDQFDSFEKEGRVSYAFRLIYQSMERTLTDEEVNTIMEAIYADLNEKGYEIR